MKMKSIHYIPLEEIRRIRALNVSPEEKAGLFANVCRLNTLYMIAKAGKQQGT